MQSEPSVRGRSAPRARSCVRDRYSAQCLLGLASKYPNKGSVAEEVGSGDDVLFVGELRAYALAVLGGEVVHGQSTSTPVAAECTCSLQGFAHTRPLRLQRTALGVARRVMSALHVLQYRLTRGMRISISNMLKVLHSGHSTTTHRGGRQFPHTGLHVTHIGSSYQSNRPVFPSENIRLYAFPSFEPAEGFGAPGALGALGAAGAAFSALGAGPADVFSGAPQLAQTTANAFAGVSHLGHFACDVTDVGL